MKVILTSRPAPQISVLALAVVLLGLTTTSANAYVDPGVGSYCFQLLIAGLTAVWFFASSLKTGLLRLFRGKGGEQAATDAETLSAQQKPGTSDSTL